MFSNRRTMWTLIKKHVCSLSSLAMTLSLQNYTKLRVQTTSKSILKIFRFSHSKTWSGDRLLICGCRLAQTVCLTQGWECLIWKTVDLIYSDKDVEAVRKEREWSFLFVPRTEFVHCLTDSSDISQHTQAKTLSRSSPPWGQFLLVSAFYATNISLWRSARAPRRTVTNRKWKIGPQCNNCSRYRVMWRTDLHNFCTHFCTVLSVPDTF